MCVYPAQEGKKRNRKREEGKSSLVVMALVWKIHYVKYTFVSENKIYSSKVYHNHLFQLRTHTELSFKRVVNVTGLLVSTGLS